MSWYHLKHIIQQKTAVYVLYPWLYLFACHCNTLHYTRVAGVYIFSQRNWCVPEWLTCFSTARPSESKLYIRLEDATMHIKFHYGCENKSAAPFSFFVFDRHLYISDPLCNIK
jgi:hypothetical protein